MKIREKLSIVLLFCGGLLFILPLSGNRSFTGNPRKVLSGVLSEDAFFSPDQVARFIVNEDSTVQLIDIRPAKEFSNESFPSAVNVPYDVFAGSDPDKYLNNKQLKTIFIGNNDLDATSALTYARGLGYENTYALKDGLEGWKSTILETKFTGERISARENALFEVRTKAARLHTELNSLPDSLKAKFLESKKFNAKKLDGGCE